MTRILFNTDSLLIVQEVHEATAFGLSKV